MENYNKEKININNDAKYEMEKFIDAIFKVKELITNAKTREEKEIVNNYIDIAQKHYDNFYNLLNNKVNTINKSAKEVYDEIKANVDPNEYLLPLESLKMFEYSGIINKLIIDEDE